MLLTSEQPDVRNRRQTTSASTAAKRRPIGPSLLRFVVTALLATAATLAAAQEPVQLRLASDEWPPFTGSRDTERSAIDLVEAALERAGVSAATTIVEWKDVEAGIRDGEFDGSAAMWRTDRREQLLLFSAPYLENRLVLVGRSGSDVSATRMSDLAGRRVAAVGRYAYGDQVEHAEGVLFINTRNDQESLDRLLAGDVEYMLVDELVARHLMDFQPDEVEANLEIGLRPLARRLLHFTLRKDVANAEAIMAAFNVEIRAMQSDGTYAKLLHVGWIRVDIDGDGLYELVPYGEYVGEFPPGTVYDVFGDMPETEVPPEKQRVVIQGDIFEGWDAIPDRYKTPPSPGGDTTFKRGTTMVTFQF